MQVQTREDSLVHKDCIFECNPLWSLQYVISVNICRIVEDSYLRDWVKPLPKIWRHYCVIAFHALSHFYPHGVYTVLKSRPFYLDINIVKRLYGRVLILVLIYNNWSAYFWSGDYCNGSRWRFRVNVGFEQFVISGNGYAATNPLWLG